MPTPQLSDRGFQFGDGLFETIRAQGGELQVFDLHWQRLKRGAEILGVRLPARRVLEARCRSLAKPPQQAESAEAPSLVAVKLQVTRGDSFGGYAAAETMPANVYVSARPVLLNPVFWQQGIKLRWCQQTLAIQPSLAGLKHCNRLEQVMARREWQQDFQEGLMCDAEGYVIEGTATNLFALINGVWLTPQLDRCGVAGIMRQQILAWMAEHKVAVKEQRLSKADVSNAESLLVCNAIVGPWPVAELDGNAKSIDPIVGKLVAAFAPPH